MEEEKEEEVRGGRAGLRGGERRSGGCKRVDNKGREDLREVEEKIEDK